MREVNPPYLLYENSGTARFECPDRGDGKAHIGWSFTWAPGCWHIDHEFNGKPACTCGKELEQTSGPDPRHPAA